MDLKSILKWIFGLSAFLGSVHGLAQAPLPVGLLIGDHIMDSAPRPVVTDAYAPTLSREVHNTWSYLDRGASGTFAPATATTVRLELSPMESLRSNDRYGSSNVPMDSWVYPALDRLAALGFIPSQSVAIRPWTRLECLRQVREAKEVIDPIDTKWQTIEAERLINDLLGEFDNGLDSNSITLESVYSRYGVIVGPTLVDGYHFGQTWRNDLGRPLRRGGSGILGYSVRANHGRLFFQSRHELQTGASTLGVTPSLSQLFRKLDGSSFGTIPPDFYPPSASTPATDQMRALTLYAGIAFSGAALSFGKQEIFWGPMLSGPLAFSDNAEPTYNLKLSATRPHPFPFIPRVGAYRFDFVFGKLAGHKYPARPYFNGQKFDITLGRDFEMSFTRWSLLWGVGHPMTANSLAKNFFSFSSSGCGFGYGDRCDPGDRKGGFDFRWRLPGIQKYVTLYADSYSDDDPSPLAAPRRNVWAPGIYFPRLPWSPHTDLRIEAASSEEMSRDEGGTRFFINNQYRDANTNKGFPLGNTVGRDGRSIEVRSSYWQSSRTRIELGLRQNKIGLQFLPGGGTITDIFGKANFSFGSRWSADLFFQRERFLIPSLAVEARQNQSGWLQVVWNPEYLPFSRK